MKLKRICAELYEAETAIGTVTIIKGSIGWIYYTKGCVNGFHGQGFAETLRDFRKMTEQYIIETLRS